MDNGEVSYRYCQEVDMNELNWEKYHFGVVTKNYKDLSRKDMINDFDIHLIKFSLFDEENMPVAKKLEAERYRLLMIRNSLVDVNTGKIIGDVDELFQKGIAHEIKT